MLVDSHAHLMDTAFQSDLSSVLDRARDAAVEAIICVGYDLPTSEAAIRLAADDPRLFATVGVHPNYVSAAPAGWLAALRDLAQMPRVVAIGETGLDYFRTLSERSEQRRAFSLQLDLASQLGLPVVIHCREADSDLLAAIPPADDAMRHSGVLHCFGGTADTMEKAVARGYYVSFAGNATFKNAQALRDIAAAVPASRLLLETDSPFLSPVPYRGRRNEPSRIVATAACLAEARATSLEELGELTTANARRLFGLDGEGTE